MANIIVATLLVPYIFLSLFSPTKGEVLGFSTDLIHRDSPDSPFYDPSLTRFDRLHNAARRSHIRANHFGLASKNASSELIPIPPGDYLMKIALGTPPVTMFAIVDTGSDLTWVQCTPCIKCYKQKPPLFNPKKSLSYHVYPYNSSTCHSLFTKYHSPNGTCEYELVYLDRSSSRGVLASETLMLGSKSSSSQPVYFPRFTFGCGFNNSAPFLFNEKGSGLVGLGGGANSLVSQIKPSISGKFSYCFTDSHAEPPIIGQINFGKNAEVSGTGVITTPIIPIEPKNYYHLNLEALSVGKHKFKLFDSSPSDSIIIIDSGTTLTYLFQPFYFKFKELVKEAMGNRTVHHPDLDLCYRISDNPRYPKIKAHFTGGARIDLKPINTFIQPHPDVTCLAFRDAFLPGLGYQIFGNKAQTNFLIGYDTVKGSVSFKPAECGDH